MMGMVLFLLDSDRAMYLHIFLHIRSILSAAVRLNVMGPYLSQRMMFKEMGPMMEEICRGIAGKRLARCDLIECGLSHLHLGPPPSDSSADQVENGPSSSWPFGEIIQTRHDSCHVRLFNS
jgi:urease accessory protein